MDTSKLMEKLDDIAVSKKIDLSEADDLIIQFIEEKIKEYGEKWKD